MTQFTVQQKVFLLLLALVTIGFGWILLPYAGAVFWAVVLAILFAPLYRRLRKRMNGKPNRAALVTLFSIIVMVLLPLSLITASLVRQAAEVYGNMSSNPIDVAVYFQRFIAALPQWLVNLLDRFGLTDIGALQARLTAGAAEASQAVARHALVFGRNTFDFLINLTIMVYLLFFLLRDGDELTRRIRAAIPLREAQQRALFGKFTIVIRAAVKGNIVVAAVQGALGGVIFWFLGIHAPLLWGVLMAFLSLLPAVGAAVVWLPVAGYLLATGSVWEGVVLIAFGTFVIGLVDNLLRPILVGKDTRMPDYVVLISTLGGIAVFGLNGFVIGPVIAAMFIACWDLLMAEGWR
jgi:predicted PurR-regulated permease PerM